jgi:hypothetical protein
MSLGSLNQVVFQAKTPGGEREIPAITIILTRTAYKPSGGGIRYVLVVIILDPRAG